MSKIFFILIYLFFIFYIPYYTIINFSNKKINKKHKIIDLNRFAPNNILMYNYIIKYCNEYNIPKEYVFRMYKLETGYNGLYDWKYNPYQTSYAGAIGPSQLMQPTAIFMNDGKYLSKDSIKINLELNVKLGIKYLRYLKNIYKEWDIVFGFYNTGRPIVNEYSKKIVY